MTDTSYSKKSPVRLFLIYLVVAVILYGGIYYFIRAKNTNASSVVTTTPVTQNFQSSSLASTSYQIYPGPLSDQAKQATSGFKIDTQTQGDGSAIVSLTSSNPAYQNQQVTVQPGYTLYFVDKNGGDDSAANDSDRTTGDDSTILVDPQGNIVK